MRLLTIPFNAFAAGVSLAEGLWFCLGLNLFFVVLNTTIEYYERKVHEARNV